MSDCGVVQSGIFGTRRLPRVPPIQNDKGRPSGARHLHDPAKRIFLGLAEAPYCLASARGQDPVGSRP
jgi:hypothetical protein